MDKKPNHGGGNVVRYKLKDGTERVKVYPSRYVPVDKESKITQSKVIDKVKEANAEELKIIYDFLTKKNRNIIQVPIAGRVEEQINEPRAEDNPA